MQVALGSDIQMVLDVCPPLPSPDPVIRAAVDRTALWAGRARKAFLAHERPDLSQFGIVQGGADLAMRAESAERTVAVGFDGYAVGGLSVGEDRVGDAAGAGGRRGGAAGRPAPLLHGDRRPGRHRRGRGPGRRHVRLRAAHPARPPRERSSRPRVGSTSATRRFADDPDPIDPACGCGVCARWSRGYLRHLLSVSEPTAPRLLTLHNVAWTFAFVDRDPRRDRRGDARRAAGGGGRRVGGRAGRPMTA